MKITHQCILIRKYVFALCVGGVILARMAENQPLPPGVASDETILGMIPYAHSRGGALVLPEDEGKIKGKAIQAMEQQVDTQLQQIYQQAETLAKQAKALKLRSEISYKIYQASMRFEPIINKVYHLYEKPSGENWMSLVAPEEWAPSNPKHLASVKLLADHTWDILAVSKQAEAEAMEAEAV
jgi:hypothetical protein